MRRLVWCALVRTCSYFSISARVSSSDTGRTCFLLFAVLLFFPGRFILFRELVISARSFLSWLMSAGRLLTASIAPCFNRVSPITSMGYL